MKMGEDVTETLEVIPRQWKLIQTVREKFTCGNDTVARRPIRSAQRRSGDGPGDSAARLVSPLM